MDWLVGFISFSLAMGLTPGPNNLMLMANAADAGFSRTLPAIAGVVIGFSLMAATLALGPGLALQSYPLLHQGLKVAGSLYLLWLAWQIATASSGGGRAEARPFTFTRALLFQWVNPKGWAAALGALTTFTEPGGDTVRQGLLLALLFVPLSMISASSWAGGGALIGTRLGSGARLVWFNRVMAVLLAASLLPVWL
jgi:threonine/homoserine/homoserine lactone efflux protein